jgi:hypothetical protein
MTLLLFNFFSPRSFFDLIRLSRAVADGFVGSRFFLGFSAVLNISVNRSIAFSRLCHWLRDSSTTTRRIPSLPMRDFRDDNIFCFCALLRFEHCSTSNSNSTRVATLLTFCPPGPLLRWNRNRISFSEMDRACVMVNRRGIGKRI